MGFIEAPSLKALRGQSLFYPAAGSDWHEALELFVDHIDEFHFCDTHYSSPGSLPSPFSNPQSYQLVSSDLRGKSTARIEPPTTERPYPYLELGSLRQVYERVSDSRRVTVVRRRGFGQCAIHEFSDHSIGVFVHRGDSPGEGGSNVYFLANRHRDYEPTSNLFDKLAQKLSDHALVLSDGSNADPDFLKRFHRDKISGAEAYALLRGQPPHRFGEFFWRCVGHVCRRNGPTLVWELMREASGPGQHRT
jgi:hypothetical protein